MLILFLPNGEALQSGTLQVHEIHNFFATPSFRFKDPLPGSGGSKFGHLRDFEMKHGLHATFLQVVFCSIFKKQYVDHASHRRDRLVPSSPPGMFATSSRFLGGIPNHTAQNSRRKRKDSLDIFLKFCGSGPQKIADSCRLSWSNVS